MLKLLGSYFLLNFLKNLLYQVKHHKELIDLLIEDKYYSFYQLNTFFVLPYNYDFKIRFNESILLTPFKLLANSLVHFVPTSLAISCHALLCKFEVVEITPSKSKIKPLISLNFFN